MEYYNVVRLFKGKPDLQFFARVQEGTHINMLEFDLSLFRRRIPGFSPKDWEGMVRKWMGLGATMDMFYQEIHPRALPVVTSLNESYDGFRLYDFSDMPAEVLMEHKEDLEIIEVRRFLDGLRTYHFTTFQNPDQLWVEYYHPLDSDIMYDLKWISEPVMDKDESEQYDLRDKLEVLGLIRGNSQEGIHSKLSNVING